MNIKTNRGIQILRILACIGVFIVHLGQKLYLEDSIKRFTDLGEYGVEMFFVISGFLACESWLRKKNSISMYYCKRLIRILPAYYFCILCYFVLYQIIYKSVPIDSYGVGWIRYAFVLNGLIPAEHTFWSNLGNTWTIPVFILFYFLFPFLIKVIRSWKTAVFATVISIVFAEVVSIYGNGYLSAFTMIKCFICGIVAYYAIEEKREKETTLMAIIIVFLNMAINMKNSTFCSIIFMAVVLLLYGLTINNKRILKLLDVIDEYTYTVYLVQGLVFSEIINRFSMGRVKTAGMAIVATIFLAFLVHNLVEKPIQNFLLKRVNRQ